ncbi:MAG: MBL fold metallo-hydrolase [Thermoleophilaceae bacterium]
MVCALGVALALALTRLTAAPAPPDRLTVSFLDVGQGDATLIQAPGGTAVLFDGGPPEGGVTRLLRRAGVGRLALVVATHQSRDHHRGLQAVAEGYRIGTLLQNGDGTHDGSFARMVSTARSRGAQVPAPQPGQVLRAGPLSVRIYGPPPRPPGSPPEDPNPRAIAAVVSYGGFDLFLSGDAESDALAQYDLPPVEAMKVSHHGSDDPGLPELLRPAASAEWPASRSASGNTYGHPRASTIAALRAGPRGHVPHRPGRHHSTPDRAGREPGGDREALTQTAAASASPRWAASACSRLSREEISTAARMAPSNASPAQVRKAFWNPSVSATVRTRSPSSNALEVAELATVAVIARPSAPPTCWLVLMSPEARPASEGSVPVTAAMVEVTKAKPSPTAASMEGKSTSPT